MLGGLTCGLGGSVLARSGGDSVGMAVFALGALGLLALVRPRRLALPWLACLALAAAAFGLVIGVARLAAIDAGALDLPAGSEVVVRGHVAAVPRRSDGEVDVRVETADGRLIVRVPEPVPDLSPGMAVRATGTIGDPGDWELPWLERLGIRDVLTAREIAILPGGRAGVAGLLDGLRSRAEAALDRGTTPAAGALLRGFVLGEDDRIDAATVDDFKRSGLAHLLGPSQ